MKKHVLISLLGLALIATVGGCSLFEGADDITFDVELKHTFVIDENFDSQGQPMPYSSVDDWDPNDEPEFEKYADKIKDITVNSVTYTVSDYQADGVVTFTGGTGSFMATANAATALASAAIAIQSVPAAQGSTHTLSYAIADLDKIADQLENVEPIFFQVAGTFSHTPVQFNVHVTIHATIKAEAL